MPGFADAQPRPQADFSPKKKGGAGKGPPTRPTHFLREKPSGRGWPMLIFRAWATCGETAWFQTTELKNP